MTQPKMVPPVSEHVDVRIYLPSDLLKWARECANELDNTLSDLIRDVLEYEKLREEKPTYTTCPEAIRQFKAYAERQAAKGGAQ